MSMNKNHKDTSEIKNSLAELMKSESIEDRYLELEKLGLPDYIIQSVEIDHNPTSAAESVVGVISDNSPKLLEKLQERLL